MDQELSTLISQLYNPVLQQRERVIEVINLFKQLAAKLRDEREYNNFAIESQIQQIIKIISQIVRAHFPKQISRKDLIHEHYQLAKYFFVLENELFYTTLSDSEQLLKLTIEDTVFISSLFLENDQSDKFIVSLSQGFLINAASRCSQIKFMSALLQVLS